MTVADGHFSLRGGVLTVGFALVYIAYFMEYVLLGDALNDRKNFIAENGAQYLDLADISEKAFPFGEGGSPKG